MQLDIETLKQDPVVAGMIALRELTWQNPSCAPTAEGIVDPGLTRADVEDAAQRLARFAPWIAGTFPDTREAGGLIESPLHRADALKAALNAGQGVSLDGTLLLKLDSHLPISGSIKARGGIYEVLKHAETLAIAAGLLQISDDYRRLSEQDCRNLFKRHAIAVGSTGNLGLSIGIIASAFGFRTTVHMSADARQWKKDKLAAHGVEVVTYDSDYSLAVAEGRRQAEADPACHFIDDENSKDLFLGYAVAALRLEGQLAALGVEVSAEKPLIVHLPCGVGGGPGGVAFGLKLVFGDAVDCWFAEPTHSPCMLLGMASGLHDAISVQDIGIDNLTAADGLAVGRPSGFVGRAMQRLIAGCTTVSDDTLFRLLGLVDRTEALRLEPSALAGLPGPWRLLATGQDRDRAARATHIVWATGGSMVPAPEMSAYLARAAEQGN